MGSTLAAVMSGKSKITDGNAKSVANDAVAKVASANRRIETVKERAAETMHQVVHTVETQSVLFLSSLARGYFGDEKVKLGGVDIAGATGLVAVIGGIAMTIQGHSSGSHLDALGNGLVGCFLADAGRKAGTKLAKDDDAPAATDETVEKKASNAGKPALRGDSPRELYLTPDDKALAPARRGSRLVPVKRAA